MMDTEFEFSCPYCGEQNFVTVFFSEGSSQQFIQDCEICCRPVAVSVTRDNEGNVVIDVKTDDGF